MKKKIKRKSSATILTEQKNYFFFKQQPVSETILEELADELYSWALEDNEALILSDFYLKKGIWPQTYYKWIKKNKKLKRAHEIALAIISNRRERGGLKGTLNPNFVLKTMPIYNSEYKELEKWRSDIRKKNEEQDKKITIVLNDLTKINKKPEKANNEKSK